MNKIKNKSLIIKVKNKGAELTRIYYKPLNTQFVSNGNTKFCGRHSPILFPIVGRLKDNETIIKPKINVCFKIINTRYYDMFF